MVIRCNFWGLPRRSFDRTTNASTCRLPDRLSGEAIHAAARLTAVADVYDAIRRQRSHKAALSHIEGPRFASSRSSRADNSIPISSQAFESAVTAISSKSSKISLTELILTVQAYLTYGPATHSLHVSGRELPGRGRFSRVGNKGAALVATDANEFVLGGKIYAEARQT